MIGLLDILLGGLLPLVVAAATTAAVSRLAGSARTGWLCGFATGYIAGQFGLEFRTVSIAIALTKLRAPHDARDWLPLVVAGAMVIGILALLANGRRWLELLLAASLCMFLPILLIRGSIYLPSQEVRDAGFATDAAWSTGEAIGSLGALAFALWAHWAVWSTAQPDDAPRTRTALALLMAVLASAVLALSGAIIYGQLLGVVAAALTGCGLAGLFGKEQAGPEGCGGPASMVYGGLLLLSVLFSGLSPWRAAAIYAASLAAVGSLPHALRRRMSTKVVAGLRMALCVLPLAILVGLAAMEFAEREQQDSESANPYEQYL